MHKQVSNRGVLVLTRTAKPSKGLGTHLSVAHDVIELRLIIVNSAGANLPHVLFQARKQKIATCLEAPKK